MSKGDRARTTQPWRVRTFVLLWLVCAIALLGRRPDLLTAPQFFAEDGAIFFHDAILGGLASLFAPYAGYHHLVPRAVALVAAPFPFAWQPALYTSVTVLLEAAACAALFPLLRWLIADPVQRAVAVVGVTLAVPADEIIGSVANVQWYLALPVLAASFAPLAARSRAAARAVAVIVGFTTPQGLIALPFAVLLWRRPAGRDPWIATLYAASSGLNVVTAAGVAGSKATSDWIGAIVPVMSFRVADPLVFGKQAAMNAAAMPLAGAALGALVLVVVIVLLVRSHGAIVAAIVAYLTIAPVVLALVTRPFPGTAFDHYTFFGADRYFVTPCAALAVALVVIASRIAAVHAARVVAAAVLLPGACLNFQEPGRLPNDDWAANAPALESWRAARDAGGPARQATASIPPAAWSVVLPSCGTGSHGGPLPRCP